MDVSLEFYEPRKLEHLREHSNHPECYADPDGEGLYGAIILQRAEARGVRRMVKAEIEGVDLERVLP